MAIVRLHNPKRRHSTRGAARRTRRRKNLAGGGGTLTYMAANTNRKRGRRRNTPVASNRRRRHNPVAAASNRRRRRNVVAHANRHHRRRNPGIVGKVKDTVMSGLYAITGGVMTISVPKAVMGESNVGVLGYVGNFITAFAGGAVIGRVLSPNAGSMFAIGGSVAIVGRLIEDFLGKTYVSFSPIDLPIPKLLGGGFRGMRGDYISQSFPVPYSSLPSGRYLPMPEAAAVMSGGRMGLGADSTWSTPWN